jgi:hypothetical protein
MWLELPLHLQTALHLHPRDSIHEAISPLPRDMTDCSNPEVRCEEEAATEMDDSTDSFDAVIAATETFQSDATYCLSLGG